MPSSAREWLVPVLDLIPPWVSPLHLTFLRGLLTLPLILVREHPWLAVWVLLVSSSCDFLDGELARHRGSATELGATLDAVADKVFVVGCLLFACDGRVDPFIVATTVAIEIGLLQARIVEWRWSVTTKSSLAGKIKTWVQSFGIAFILTRISWLEACGKVILAISLVFATLSLATHLASVFKHSHSTSA